MKELVRITEMLVECLEKNLTLVKVCGDCGYDNCMLEDNCASCLNEILDYTIETSYEMWKCPWCEYPYFDYEHKALEAKYCKSCHIKWDVTLEKAPEEEELIEIDDNELLRDLIRSPRSPAYDPYAFQREFQQTPTPVPPTIQRTYDSSDTAGTSAGPTYARVYYGDTDSTSSNTW